MTQYPGMLLLLLFFMMFPLILGGKIQEKTAEMIASLAAAVFALVPILAVYIGILALFKIAFT